MVAFFISLQILHELNQMLMWRSKIYECQAVIEALKIEGVRFVFGLPGTTIMPLLDALYDEPSIRYITVRHEQAAAHMADGYARGSNHVATCMASRGPGAANMTVGLYNAYAESIPVLAIIGQVADSIYYRDSFEELDLMSFFKPITKWSAEVHRVERIPELMQRGVRTSLTGRRRPVMISLPLDVQTKGCAGIFPLSPGHIFHLQGSHGLGTSGSYGHKAVTA